MKKLKWALEDATGKLLTYSSTREGAREEKKWYEANIFENWMAEVKPPVKILREEWELVGKKVVR